MPAESNEVPQEATPEVKPEVVAARPLVFLDIEVIITRGYPEIKYVLM